MKNESKKEGYWYSAKSPHLPQPLVRTRPFKGKTEFLAALDEVEAKARRRQFKSFSTCRVCDCDNGRADYIYREWEWPSGYRHYVADHNVEPTDEFRTFIMKAGAVSKPASKTVDPVVTKKDLRQLMSVVTEYTGSEKYRLFSMLTVKKMQKQLNGQKIPASVASLTVDASEDELHKALKRLGD